MSSGITRIGAWSARMVKSMDDPFMPRTFGSTTHPGGMREIIRWTADEIGDTVTACLVNSADPELTGVCCVNLDDTVRDAQGAVIFEAIARL